MALTSGCRAQSWSRHATPCIGLTGDMPRGRTPATKFQCGDDATSELTMTYEVGVLLFDDGFWEYCADNVPAARPEAFYGPYEGGILEPGELEPFILALTYWADRYGRLKDTVYSQRRGLGDQPPEEIELPPWELADALNRIRLTALRCQDEQIPLYIAT